MFPIGDENEPGHGLPIVTVALILINVVVFVLLQGAGANEAFTYGFSAIPVEVIQGVDLVQPQQANLGGEVVVIPQAPGPAPIQLTLLTSMFMHGGWAHLLGNMLFLFIFGDNVEHRMGPILYLLFYLAAGVVASFAQILLDTASVVPTLGASGAISGVLGAYIVLFPGNRVTVFVFRFVTAVPAIVAIGMWAALQFFNGVGQIAETQQTDGIAYAAHIGGFVAGVVIGLVARALLPPRASPVPPSRFGPA